MDSIRASPVPCQNPRESVTLGFMLDAHDRPSRLPAHDPARWRAHSHLLIPAAAAPSPRCGRPTPGPQRGGDPSAVGGAAGSVGPRHDPTVNLYGLGGDSSG